MFTKKGEMFCPDCYHHFPANNAVFIARLDTDDGQIPLRIKPVWKNFTMTVDVFERSKKLTVIGTAELRREGGIVRGIRAKVKRSGVEQEIMSDETLRVCPYCGENRNPFHFLPHLMGFSDSYLVNLIGMKSVGKTSFSNSLVTNKSQNELGRFLNAPVTAYRTGSSETLQATGENKLYIRRCLRIEKKPRPITIFFGDVAGESFIMNEESGHTNFQIEFLDMLKKDSDAILLLHDQREVNVMPAADQNQLGFTNLVNPLLGRITKQETPVICLLTKGDKLKEFITQQNYALEAENHEPIVTETSPVFDASEIPSDPDGAGVTLARHMGCANDIMRQIVDGAISIRQDTPCFIVSAGTTQGNVINYDNSRNILLPLIYLMRQWIV